MNRCVAGLRLLLGELGYLIKAGVPHRGREALLSPLSGRQRLDMEGGRRSAKSCTVSRGRKEAGARPEPWGPGWVWGGRGRWDGGARSAPGQSAVPPSREALGRFAAKHRVG